MYIETTGLNERFLVRFPNGEEHFVVRQYWSLLEFNHYSDHFRDILLYKPLPDAIQDMDYAMFWLCEEAASELDSSLRVFHSVKYGSEFVRDMSPQIPMLQITKRLTRFSDKLKQQSENIH